MDSVMKGLMGARPQNFCTRTAPGRERMVVYSNRDSIIKEFFKKISTSESDFRDADHGPDCRQNLVDCSLGRVPPLQEFHQSSFINFY